MNEVENLTKLRSRANTEFGSVSLNLLHERAIWVPTLNALLIADLHFGKAAHFRKSGVPIPENIHYADLHRLSMLHQEFRPTHTYFLGDLFHSDWNEQWEFLNDFLAQLKGTEFHLIKGNHDVLGPEFYRQSILTIHDQPLILSELVLSHEPLKSVPPGMLNLCGHIHPGVRLAGKAKQSVMLPCFFQTPSHLILPAFGNFTGLAQVRRNERDSVWAIANEKIIPVLSGTSIG